MIYNIMILTNCVRITGSFWAAKVLPSLSPPAPLRASLPPYKIQRNSHCNTQQYADSNSWHSTGVAVSACTRCTGGRGERMPSRLHAARV